jgi:hypothetical protein
MNIWCMRIRIFIIAFSILAWNCTKIQAPSNKLPVISNITQFPDQITPGDVIIVKANIDDPDGFVQEADLIYKINSVEHEIRLDTLFGFYYTDIPAQRVETTIDYYVRASDDYGQSVSSISSCTVQYDQFAIYLSPLEDTIAVGETCIKMLKIVDVVRLFGMTFNLIYDNSGISIDSVTIPVNSFWEGREYLFHYEPTDSSMEVGISAIQTEGMDDISGSGCVALIYISSIRTGLYNIGIGNILVVDERGVINASLPLLLRDYATVYVL